MECETALSNETKTKEPSFPALHHAVLEHGGANGALRHG